MTKKRRLKHRNSIKRHTRESRWTTKAILGKRNMEKQKKKKKSNPGLKKGQTGNYQLWFMPPNFSSGQKVVIPELSISELYGSLKQSFL